MPQNALQHYRPRTPGSVDAIIAPANLLTGLQAWWNLNETSGSRADSIGSNTLSVTGTVTSNTGKVGNAAEVASGANYLGGGSGLTPSGSPRSVSAWFYGTSLASQEAFMLCGATYNSGTPLWILLARQSPTAFIGVYHGGTYRVSATVASTNTWYHVVYTFDGLYMTLYVNAALAYANLHVDSGTGGSIFIGNTFSPFTGRVDEVGIWNRALSGAEVLQLYNGGNGVTYPTFA